MYACLDVDVVVGGFQERHFNFVQGVVRTSAKGLRLCKLSNDISGRPLRPGESFLRQQLAQLCFCHFLSQCGDRSSRLQQMMTSHPQGNILVIVAMVLKMRDSHPAVYT